MSSATQSAPAYPPIAVARYTIIVLAVAYTFSFLDRQILVLLIEPVRRDLGLSDTGVSLLTGLAFAVLYAIMGLPMARAADLWSRRKVILLGVTLWGSMTTACGFASSFAQLFLARMGVGVGEAALTPAAYAMVPDLFPPERQARAMSVFTLGAFLGSGLALLIGGFVIGMLEGVGTVELPWLGPLRSWQLALICVGAATLVLLLPLARIPEAHRAAQVGMQSAVPLRRLQDVVSLLWKRRSAYAAIFIGVPLANLFGYGMQAWMPTFFIRHYGWRASEVGLTLGTLGVIFGALGGLSGAWVADRWRKRGMVDANLRIASYAVAATAVLPAAVAFAPTAPLALVALAALNICIAIVIPLVPAALQTITPRPVRAQVSALFLLVVNLIGIGVGPTAIALITEYVFEDAQAVGWSIALVGMVACGMSAVIITAGLRGFRAATAQANMASAAA